MLPRPSLLLPPARSIPASKLALVASLALLAVGALASRETFATASTRETFRDAVGEGKGKMAESRRAALVVIAPEKCVGNDLSFPWRTDPVQQYQDQELEGTVEGLQNHGFNVMLASSVRGPCKGVLGGSTRVEMRLDEVDPLVFDRVAFIGGPGAALLFHDTQAHRVARAFDHAGKVVGAICLGPVILAEAGVLKGKEATVWTGPDKKEAHILQAKGAKYTGADVTVSKNVVTANGPPAAKKFGETLAKLEVS